MSFHSPVPWAWYKTLEYPIDSPVLAVLGQDTRGDKPADTGFSASNTRERWESLCWVRSSTPVCAGVCSLLVRKGLSCLLSPNLAGYLPVGFTVNWDQIREGMAKGGGGYYVDLGSRIPGLPTQQCADAILHCPHKTSLLVCFWEVSLPGPPAHRHHTQD